MVREEGQFGSREGKADARKRTGGRRRVGESESARWKEGVEVMVVVEKERKLWRKGRKRMGLKRTSRLSLPSASLSSISAISGHTFSAAACPFANCVRNRQLKHAASSRPRGGGMKGGQETSTHVVARPTTI